MADSKEQPEQPLVVNLTRDTSDPTFYARDVESKLKPAARQMLASYAAISPEDQLAHISSIRDRAYEIAPYPSIGLLTWLNPYIQLHPSEHLILSKVKDANATILDCGCFISSDLRYLASKGAPTEKMYGFDIEPRFFDIGFDFFRDRSTFKGTFIQADGTKEPESTALKGLLGEVDVIWSPKFLHVFPRQKQIEVAARLVKLLRPVKGSVFVGSQNGVPEAREMPLGKGVDEHGVVNTIFLGNEKTIVEDWKEVGRLTGLKFEVEARLFDMRTIGWHEDDGSAWQKILGYNLQWTATLVE